MSHRVYIDLLTRRGALLLGLLGLWRTPDVEGGPLAHLHGRRSRCTVSAATVSALANFSVGLSSRRRPPFCWAGAPCTLVLAHSAMGSAIGGSPSSKHLEENGERKKGNVQTATHQAAPSRKEENKKKSSNRKYVLKESAIEKADMFFCPNSGSCRKGEKNWSWN